MRQASASGRTTVDGAQPYFDVPADSIGDWPFNNPGYPVFPVFNLAVAGSGGGDPGPGTYPARDARRLDPGLVGVTAWKSRPSRHHRLRSCYRWWRLADQSDVLRGPRHALRLLGHLGALRRWRGEE